MTVTVRVEFLGGLDQTFGGDRERRVVLEEGEATIGGLVTKLASSLKNEKDYELFVQEGEVRPGILVLINDTDWELEGKEECELENGDIVSFTSTLHGG
ncbi:hypothetical protein CANINC_004755 [Pichia inconspicua]|uniref:Ubiquitin-related modifier 1 n=1 Tax=Pichia inconspicua TaxID=52247 RepID=A0A4T0WV80_9ASCO|nr:hypothetical protein CANINC_004755 [[Candida] inconspicua]